MRAVQSMLAIALLVACGSGASEPTELSYANLLGTWSLTVSDTAGCAGRPFTPVTITFNIQQSAADTGLLGLGLYGRTSTWDGPDSLQGRMSGFLPLLLPSSAILNLLRGNPPDSLPADSIHVLQILAKVSRHLVLTGVLYDPPPPSTAASSLPQLGSAPCQYRVTGSHS